MIELRMARGSTTGPILAQLLRERGIELGTSNTEAVVSYGVPVQTSLPCLNANAGRINKFEELNKLQDAGILVPYHSLDGSGLNFPILGRKFKHSKGRDIIPILQNDQEFQWRKAGGHSDFFVSYIPRHTEYRVWAYRRQRLGVYEKVMARPKEYSRIGANYQNGFSFQFVPAPGEEIWRLGVNAVDALGLDFGAADILVDTQNRPWVLEVNTAPGQEEARAGLTNLANKITRWRELGFPKRRGAE